MKQVEHKCRHHRHHLTQDRYSGHAASSTERRARDGMRAVSRWPEIVQKQSANNVAQISPQLYTE